MLIIATKIDTLVCYAMDWVPNTADQRVASSLFWQTISLVLTYFHSVSILAYHMRAGFWIDAS